MENYIVFAMITVFAIVSTAFSLINIVKLAKLKSRFHTAIVLIPLYKKNTVVYIVTGILSAFLILSEILLISYEMYATGFFAFIGLVAPLALSVTMLTTKTAVLDSGVIVPFRFIDWAHLYDYVTEGNTIFFCGDKDGYDTIAAVTPKMSFDESNLEKLNYILNKHKVRR